MQNLQNLLPILSQLAGAFAAAAKTAPRETPTAPPAREIAEDWGGLRYSDHVHHHHDDDSLEHHAIAVASAPAPATVAPGGDIDTLEAGEHADESEADDEVVRELTGLEPEDVASDIVAMEIADVTFGASESVEHECTWESTS